MRRIRKRDILKVIIAIIAIANLFLLFGFEYEIFGFKWEDFYTQKYSREPETTMQGGTGVTSNATTATAAEPQKEESAAGGTSNIMSGAEEASTAENSVAETNIRKCKVISEKNARVRSGPGTEYNRITSVPRGTVLTVLDVEDNGWVHVRMDDGVEGYISGDLVEMIDEE